MTMKEAQAIADKTPPEFWLVMSQRPYGSHHLYKCKTGKKYGQVMHKKRLVRCTKFNGKGFTEFSNSPWYEEFGLAWQLYRTDWTVQILTTQEVSLIRK